MENRRTETPKHGDVSGLTQSHRCQRLNRLSGLQRTIIQRALENRRRETLAEVGTEGANIRWTYDHVQPAGFGADVYYPEVLAIYYGWLAWDNVWRGWRGWHGGGRLFAPDDLRRPRPDMPIPWSPDGHYFSKAAIGHRRYAAGRAALSRAVRRLVDAELVTIQTRSAQWPVPFQYSGTWTGVNLTPAGVEVGETCGAAPIRPTP